MNPWGAPSLEWASGQTSYGFRSIVPVTTRYPLWDQPGFKDDEMAGRGYLPDAPTREREALVTGPITGEPEQVIRLPGPGWVGFLSALFSAVALAATTLKFTNAAMIFGVLAALAFLVWLWSLDPEKPRGLVDAGRGLALPIYSNNSSSVGWWGMMVVLISDAAVIASLAFAYLFLWTARPMVWPPDGSELPGFAGVAPVGLAVILAYALFLWAERLIRADRRGATAGALAGAALFAALALWLGWTWFRGLGIDHTATSYGAAVGALLGYMAFHLVMGGVMALWCVLRLGLGLGMIDAWRSLTIRVCLLWWHVAAPGAILVLILVAGFPHVTG